MVNLHWPDGVITCPHCDSQNVGKLVVSERKTKDRIIKARTYSNGTVRPARLVKGETFVRRLWNCHHCKGQFTAKVGSIFEVLTTSVGKMLRRLRSLLA